MLNNLLPAVAALLMLSTVVFSAAAPPANQTRVVREPIEWCDIWIPDVDKHALPRVLLIGDSITRAYGPRVEKLLDGKAYCARLATSSSIGDPALLVQVAMVLGQYKFDVIHFNNGMHGWGYSEDEYQQHFPELLATIKKYAPDAKLIWASTTPVRKSGHVEEIDPRTERVRARNRIAADYLAQQHIPIDDLFALVEPHPEYSGNDGVHFNEQGSSVQATQVAEAISAVLK